MTKELTSKYKQNCRRLSLTHRFAEAQVGSPGSLTATNSCHVIQLCCSWRSSSAHTHQYNMNKIYSNTLANIQKPTTLQDPDTLHCCSRRCGRLKQCVSRKHPSPRISSSASVAALHVCRN